jgi:hypothetical protein
MFEPPVFFRSVPVGAGHENANCSMGRPSFLVSYFWISFRKSIAQRKARGSDANDRVSLYGWEKLGVGTTRTFCFRSLKHPKQSQRSYQVR